MVERNAYLLYIYRARNLNFTKFTQNDIFHLCKNYRVSCVTSHVKYYAANLIQVHIVLDDKLDPVEFENAFQRCLQIIYREIRIRFGRGRGLNWIINLKYLCYQSIPMYMNNAYSYFTNKILISLQSLLTSSGIKTLQIFK